MMIVITVIMMNIVKGWFLIAVRMLTNLGPYCCKDTWITMVAWALIKSQLRAASSLAVGFRPQVLEAHKSNKVNKIPSLEWPFGRFFDGRTSLLASLEDLKIPAKFHKINMSPAKGTIFKKHFIFQVRFRTGSFPVRFLMFLESRFVSIRWLPVSTVL